MRGTSLTNKIQSKRVQGVLKHGCSPDLRKNTGVARYKRDLKKKQCDNCQTMRSFAFLGTFQTCHFLMYIVLFFYKRAHNHPGTSSINVSTSLLRGNNVWPAHTHVKLPKTIEVREPSKPRTTTLRTRSCLQTMVSGYNPKIINFGNKTSPQNVAANDP